MYASSFVEKLTLQEKERLLGGERDNDLLDAIASVLATQVEARVRTALFPGYRNQSKPLTRVRGRIDHLQTASRRLMDSGRVQCHFTEQTLNRPRYRYLLVTLKQASHRVTSQEVRAQCVSAARKLEQNGVSPVDPDPSFLAREQFSHFDSSDRKLLQLARLTRDMHAPEHTDGSIELPRIARDEAKLRQLFEKAMLGFYRCHFTDEGYTVNGERRSWLPDASDNETSRFLPTLNADIVLRSRARAEQVVIECKFAPVFTEHHNKTMVSPSYMRQIYSYASIFARDFEGSTRAVLLGAQVRESSGPDLDFTIDPYPMRITQVDLTGPPSEIRKTLMAAVDF
nr:MULTISPECIES: hypothetical protein [unclassified Leucobacter]